MSNEQKDKRLFAVPASRQVSTIILVVVHVAGIIGLQTEYKDLFLMCTPVNLLLSVGLLFWNHNDFSKSFYIFCFLTYLAGYFIEVAGIKTRIIFGDYWYGGTLGLKVLDVPIIIGVNWLLLIYCVGVISNKLKISNFFKSLLGAGVLAATDIFIEIVALKYDFWHWWGNYPPLQNYIAWFIVSFLLLFLFHSMNFKKDNKLAQGLFIIQLVFFIALSVL